MANMDNSVWNYPKVVLVTYGTMEPFRKRMVNIPCNLQESDLTHTLRTLHIEMLADNSIHEAGGNLNSSMDDLIMYYYDHRFQQHVEWPANSTFQNIESNLFLKIRPPQFAHPLPCNQQGEIQSSNIEISSQHHQGMGSVDPAPSPAGNIDDDELLVIPDANNNYEECNEQAAVASMGVDSTPPSAKKQRRKQAKTSNVADISLPQLTPILETALTAGQLFAHRPRFVRLHAKHLYKMVAPLNPSKAMYTLYAKMIVAKYNVMANEGDEPWLTIKELIVKCICNRRYFKSKAARIQTERMNRNTTPARPAGDEPDVDHHNTDANNESDCLQSSAETCVARQKIVRSQPYSMAQILCEVPAYKCPETIWDDFLTLTKSSEQVLQAKMSVLIGKLRTYTGAEHLTDLELLLEINKKCSSTGGTKGKIPFITEYQSGEEEGAYQLDDYPRGIILMENGNIVELRVLAKDGATVVFPVNRSQSIFFLMLAIYYCFDIHYPARYGLLRLIDVTCLTLPKEKAPKTATAKKVPVKFSDFKHDFDKFLAGK